MSEEQRGVQVVRHEAVEAHDALAPFPFNALGKADRESDEAFIARVKEYFGAHPQTKPNHVRDAVRANQ